MTERTNLKPIPRSILIFGASGHIGGPLARFLQREAPGIRLRLVSNRLEAHEDLRKDHPSAEIVAASYYDQSSLDSAVAGMEGIFVLTPGGANEELAMNNLVAAVKRAGTAVHILRFVGFEPEANIRRVPRLFVPVHRAKDILDASELPVTYLNSGASFMDNVLRWKNAIVRESKLIWHDRMVPYIDPRDIAEVAGRIFLSDNHRHLYQLHTMNNNHDILRGSQVAAMISEVLGRDIAFDGSKEAFMKAMAANPNAELLWEFLEYEESIEVVWARNDFVERTIGRKPATMRQWLEEHKHLLLA